MGIFDKFKKSKKDDISQLPEIKEMIVQPQANARDFQENLTKSGTEDETTKIKLDLVLSEINNIKMNIEMINERLKIIERKIDQKGQIRYV